ncbi:hypothetical protein M3Y95_00257000 [Aphelenchoides besseyi]|nr:hypothetical protein M3Y95_00257000 [Aphelenchoides besseyi]
MSSALFVVEFKNKRDQRCQSLITSFCLKDLHYCADVDINRRESVQSNEPQVQLPSSEEYRFSSTDGIVLEDYVVKPNRQIVKSGSLLQLIGWMTSVENKSRDFERVFLLMFRSFTSQKCLLELLIERFDIPLPKALQELADSKASLFEEEFYRFCLQYRHPIQQRYYFKITRVLQFMEGKCSKVGFTDLQKIWVAMIRTEVNKRLQNTPTESLLTVVEKHFTDWMFSSTFLLVDSTEFAQQLTLLQFEIYRRIRGVEMVDAAWTKTGKEEQSPHVLQMIAMSTNLTYSIAREIVEEVNITKRVVLFRKVIQIMVECERLNNFNGVVDLNAALNCAAVFRLKSTKSKLTVNEQDRLNHFNKLCEPHGREIASRLRSCTSACVPFVGSFLSQIFLLNVSRSNFVEQHDGGEIPIISFRKCRKLAALIHSLLKFRRKSFELQPNLHLMKVLMSLRPEGNFTTRNTLEAYLYERSRQIEPSS